jgi:HK97 family phage major capsid protein
LVLNGEQKMTLQSKTIDVAQIKEAILKNALSDVESNRPQLFNRLMANAIDPSIRFPEEEIESRCNEHHQVRQQKRPSIQALREAAGSDPQKIAQVDAYEKEVHKEISRKVKNMESIENGQSNKVPAKAITSKTLFASHQDAYDAGQWLRARFTGNANALQHCIDRGMISNSMVTWDNPSAGFLCPTSLEDSIIELRESFGKFRQNAQNVTMGEGSMVVPKMSGEITSYYVAEASTITPSDMTVTQVSLEAKKLACLTTMSSELNEDSVISIAEMVARSIAYSFAVQEDQAGFNGDGTSTYGGIVGLASALQAGSKVTATGRATFSALTFTDFENVIAKAKRFGVNQRWFISRTGWATSIQRLMLAAGGVSISDIQAGAEGSFMGFPVVWCEVLESRTSGTSGLPACYFGDLSTGAYIGTRRGISIALDGSRYFEQDLLCLRGLQRYDINVFDRGDATNAGGLVELIFG